MSAIRPEPPPFMERRQFLTFRLGGRIRGLDSTRIVRVAEIHHITPLPSDLRCNLGLVTHRGVVAGLMDLELLEHQSATPPVVDPQEPGSDRATQKPIPRKLPEGPFHCIFARFPGGVAGFAIDELLELKSFSLSTESLPFDAVELDSLKIFK